MVGGGDSWWWVVARFIKARICDLKKFNHFGSGFVRKNSVH